MSDRRTLAIKSLNPGSELLGCILHDCKTWMKVLGPDISERDARLFLLNRIDAE